MAEEEESVTDEEIKDALAAVEAGKPDLTHILDLVFASLEREEDLAPQLAVTAVVAKYETEDEYLNGGADQFVWNYGEEMARTFGEAWVAIGAVQNGELLLRLADEFHAYVDKVGEEAIDADPTKRFLEFREKVNGPFFGVADPDDEIGDALVAWSVANKHLYNAAQN